MPDYAPGENKGRKIRIRKNIPIPTPNKKWRWDELDVGDCFDAPFHGEQRRFVRQMQAQASRAGRKYGLKFKTGVTRTGLRIWRRA